MFEAGNERRITTTSRLSGFQLHYESSRYNLNQLNKHRELSNCVTAIVLNIYLLCKRILTVMAFRMFHNQLQVSLSATLMHSLDTTMRLRIQSILKKQLHLVVEDHCLRYPQSSSKDGDTTGGCVIGVVKLQVHFFPVHALRLHFAPVASSITQSIFETQVPTSFVQDLVGLQLAGFFALYWHSQLFPLHHLLLHLNLLLSMLLDKNWN